MNDFNVSSEQNKVYVGIDVHKKTYAVTVDGDHCNKKKITMAANPNSLVAFLKNNYIDSKVFSTYEAGFCGFYLHRKLCSLGINNIVVNLSAHG